MKTPDQELLEAHDRLLKFVREFEYAEETKSINDLWQRAKDLGKSASGSWLGYQANVYYRDFAPPPPGVHFNVEHGIAGSPWSRTESAWVEHRSEDLMDEIFGDQGELHLQAAEKRAEAGLELLTSIRADVSSVLSIYLAKHEDPYVRRLAEEIESAKVLTAADIANDSSPKRQIITQDMRAVQQGIWAPPHIKVQARITAAHQPAAHGRQLAERLERLASHISRSQAQESRASRIGTNVFIGHGRSPVWRDLKDFLKDRLRLPYDEFNRVPVAGITNIARLSEMLDAAGCAFIVLTAEDERADGTTQARMNVIHEVGLFQGRLGFTKAIVLLEEGCEEFSNIQGLGQIRFPTGNVSAKFEDIRQVLEREGLLEANAK